MSGKLTVVRPTEITPAMLVSTNVPETDYAEWASGTTYAAGDRVILAAQHKVYQSIAAGNVGNDPTTTLGTKWQEVGPTNRWKAFDDSVSRQTANASLISYRLQPGAAVTYVGAVNLTGATSMRVRVVDPTYGTVYDKTVNLSALPVDAGWWAWFFGERRQPTQALFNDLPSFPGADVLVDITGSSALAVGVILLGQAREFAMGVKAGARVGINDYSRKERNEYGDVVVVERAFARRANFSMLLQSQEVDAFNDFLATVRAVPCLWIASTRFESTTVFGFYKSFDILLSYYDFADAELELEGLT